MKERSRKRRTGSEAGARPVLEWGLVRGSGQPFCTRAPVFTGPGCHPRTTRSAPGSVYPLPTTLLLGRWGVGPGLRSPSWPSLAIQDSRACQPLPCAWYFISAPSILGQMRRGSNTQTYHPQTHSPSGESPPFWATVKDGDRKWADVLAPTSPALQRVTLSSPSPFCSQKSRVQVSLPLFTCYVT